ncbi:MAG: response regulator transcription factor [Acidimicrobiia bacterium]|nr:response regulator transcription factor [Acidimicrobiia bacterium]
MSHSILIVDDHPIVRQGLKSLLSNYDAFEVVAEAGTIGDAIDRYAEMRPDVALVDIKLGSESGLDLLDAILERDPGARVLIVSSFDDPEFIDRSLKAGALGYVLKADSPSVLVTAIETVAAGRPALGPDIAAHLVDHLVAGPHEEPILEPVERRMLEMVAAGASNVQIASAVFMSDTSVKRRLRTVFGKLGVESRTEAVAEAARRGLI